jgi:hypothetical protein
MKRIGLLCALVLGGCTSGSSLLPDGGSPVGDMNVSLTCRPCTTSADCANGACVQYANDNYCAARCQSGAECAADEDCIASTAFDGSEVSVCVPRAGACGGNRGCGTCPQGTQCDVVTATCMPIQQTPDLGTGACGTLEPPSASSCCSSCNSGAGTCQANGCYGGWWCDSSACKCSRPPTNCGSSGGVDMGSMGGGDLGAITGQVGPSGGTVSRLYFAVVGDTRPGNIDDTNGYPSAIVDKIYADIEAMNPRPQFVVTTGDYMFASTGGTQQQPQMTLYQQASAQFTGGPIFSAMGNHECTGATASNCAGSPTTNYNVFMDAMVKPLGKTTPYYRVDFSDTNATWTAKILVAACNAWDTTQEQWLSQQLGQQTTYTIVVRHEPMGTSGAPCVSEMDALLKPGSYTLFLVGHSHTFAHSGSEVTVGNGGAPITGSAHYGYATVEQQANGFLVTEYDYATAQPLGSFTVP